mgnify:CR=1 FL=1
MLANRQQDDKMSYEAISSNAVGVCLLQMGMPGAAWTA